MIITTNQLKRYLNIPQDIEVITNQNICETASYKPSSTATNIVVGLVETCVPHPNSDHLSITTVNVGKKEILQIVCGAPNVAAGQYVIVAKVGAILPGGFEIKESAIRGIESSGMICSLQELGFEITPEKYQNGIFYFPKPKPLGQDGLVALNYDDHILELDLTPNRSDLLSVIGYAYDLAAMTNQLIQLPKYEIKEVFIKNPLVVDITTNGCYEYNARVIEVEIEESPWWMQAELLKRGIKPINNVVDISNIVLFEYGTPLHMFDADTFGSNQVLIRDAYKDEEIITLDGEKHRLEQGDVVITNGQKPVALGGVMGLENSMITNDTKKVILEAANFDPIRIRKTSSRLNISTDSSIRFERGVDSNTVRKALDYAIYLLMLYARGEVYYGVARKVNKEFMPKVISIEPSYINSNLGINLAQDDIRDIFLKYGFEVNEINNHLDVIVPSRRIDIEIKADLLEEVGRLYGYDNIKAKPLIDNLAGGQSNFDFKQDMIRLFLTSLGFHEIISYSLIKENEVHNYQNIGPIYKVLKPLTEERKALRQSLINGLLSTYNYNKDRKQENINLFEIGNIYSEGIESLNLAVLLSGNLVNSLWQKKDEEPNFFDLKGILEALLNKFGQKFELKAIDEVKYFHPNRQANILVEQEIVGKIANMHPKVANKNVYVFELSLTELLNLEYKNSYEPISKYPNMVRDIAFIIDKKIPLNKIEFLIKQTTRKYLIDLILFDVYQGENVDKDKRSLAYRLTFNNPEKTLESDDIDKIMSSLRHRLEFELKAEIR